MVGPVAVFISYALADDDLRKQLEAHLRGLITDGVIRVWGQGQIGAGQDRRAQIEEHLHAAEVVLLLLSADYFASGPQHDGELLPALERARAGGKRVIPILVRPFDRHATVLTVLPARDGAVTQWSNPDAAWEHVVAEIRKLIGALPGVDARGPRPEPAYENAEIRALAGRLERARARCAALQTAGQDTAGVDAEILDLRRKLREGGQLRAGDALEDGRYQLLGFLGRGGFATVWKALDQQTGARVAIKVLHPELARDPSRRERFFRGARIMADLQHPAVVRVLATDGDDGGYLFFVMELIDGEDLHHAVLGGRLPRERVAAVILRVGEALAEAHAKRKIHRDVKPPNILLDKNGEPRLTDFDLVAAEDTTGGTRTGALGTLLFTAPEQMANAKDVDARADVYSLGMTAVFCYRGAPLPEYTFRRPERVIEALECSAAVKAVLTRATEEKREDRYLSAEAFCEALLVASSPPLEIVAPPERGQELHAQEQALARPFPWRRTLILTSIFGTMASLLGFGSPAALRYIKKTNQQIENKLEGPAPRASAEPTITALTASAVVTPPPPPPPGCPEGTVLIPAGTFIMGSADGEPREKPPHRVKLSAFCMDKTEVTVAAYRQCTKEARNGVTCAAPGTGTFCNGAAADRETHPINCVDWTQADTYCRWAGAALPTEAQWEYAARGTDGRKYPWGNTEPGPRLLNACGSECRAMGERLGAKGWKVMYDTDDGAESTSPVGRYLEGKSPFGVLDMAGNVLEWVADWYGPYPPEGNTIPEDPKGPETSPESRRVIRGGGWDSSTAAWVRAANRFWNVVSIRYNNVGFRCSRGLQ